jgi:hypothetical protein
MGYVVFEHEDGCIANANDADLERRIYLCVKYQALLRAELKSKDKISNGSSLLVTDSQLSPSLQALADLLGVRDLCAVPKTRSQNPMVTPKLHGCRL